MDSTKVTYLPNMYEMINSSSYEIATDTTDAHMAAIKRGDFGTNVIQQKKRKRNIIIGSIVGLTLLGVALWKGKGIKEAASKLFSKSASSSTSSSSGFWKQIGDWGKNLKNKFFKKPPTT